jgi:hypothetical protein
MSDTPSLHRVTLQVCFIGTVILRGPAVEDVG